MGRFVLEVRHREVLARSATFSLGEHTTQTPRLIVPETRLGGVTADDIRLGVEATGDCLEFVSGGTWFHPHAVGDSPDALVIPAVRPVNSTEVQVTNVGDDVAVWHDAAGWTANPAILIGALAKAREQAGTRLLYAPGVGTPDDYALWAYLGVDLFDASPLLLAATRGERLTADGPEPSSISAEELAHENLQAARAELDRVRATIESGDLRNLVERRAYVRPRSIELLRRADRAGALVRHAPRVGGDMPCITPESLWRPEVEAFRARIRTSYQPPEADVLVLLPCSARKPYGRSKSHRYFARALDDSGIRHHCHEVMVTSPLGVVPRELENTWPAASYDVPVTGRWMADEERVIRDQLSALLDKGNYKHVIAHVPAGTWSFIRDLLPDDAYHSNTHGAPQSIAGCNDLKNALARLNLEGGDPAAGGRAQKLRSIHALATFQFNESVAAALTDGAKAVGKVPFIKLLGPEGQRAMLTDRGLLSLTLEGAAIVAAQGVKRVHIGDFWPTKTSSLFAVGVEDCDDDVRLGDSVAIVHGDQVRGVGTALMTPAEMRGLKRGSAVQIRHLAKPPTAKKEVLA